SAVSTTTSIDMSNTIDVTMRIPRSGYGIQVSACVHARSDAANNAGQYTGTATPAGKLPAVLIANHSSIIETQPYSIGHPASAADETGRVNIRGGYIDSRAPRSPEMPNVNTARR